MTRRNLVFRALYAFLVLLMLSGCRPETPDPEDSGWLTDVFRGTVFPMPEGYTALPDSAAYDPDTGLLRFIAAYLTETAEPDGTIQSRYDYAVVEATEDAVLSERPLPLTFGRPTAALFSGNMLRWVEEDDDRAVLRKLDLETGESDNGISLRGLFRYSTDLFFTVHDLEEDADGNLCLYSYPEILVLTPAGEWICSIRADDMNGLAADRAGRIWAWGWIGQAMGMAPVDPQSGELGKTVPLPADTKEILFAPGRDLCLMTDNGIAAYDFTEDGRLSEAGDPVVSFVHSDFDISSGQVPALFSEDLFLAAERSDAVLRGWTLSLYRRAGDIDPDSVTVLRTALSANGFVTDQIRHKAVLFNRTHDTVRIEIDDYTPSPDQGPAELYDNEKRLALEITAGTYRPDLVICMAGGPVARIGAEQGWFRDLTPLTDRAGLLNRDNLLGCVLRTFTDGDGRLFALTDRFILPSALLSTPELVGENAERGGWTTEAFLDFAQSLPEGVILTEYLTRETAEDLLFGQEGCAAFIEGNTARFDDGLFARCLEWIRSLPTTEEYRSHLPFGLKQMEEAELFPYYRDGQITLKSMRITSLERIVRLEAVFGTKDWILMGRPAPEGRSLPVTPRAVFAVTAGEERADAAWEALAALMTPLANDRYEDNSIPAFVTEFETELEILKDRVYRLKYSGGVKVRGKSEPPPANWERDPGFETEFTEEDAVRVRDLFENRAGVPYSETVNDEIAAIVNEEVSAFLGGVGSAQDCAEKVQSRVSLWLGEHG